MKIWDKSSRMTKQNLWKTAFKIWNDMVCLSRPYPFKILKSVFHQFYLVHSWRLCSILHWIKRSAKNIRMKKHSNIRMKKHSNIRMKKYSNIRMKKTATSGCRKQISKYQWEPSYWISSETAREIYTNKKPS